MNGMYSKPVNFGKWTNNEIFELTVNELYDELFSNCHLAQRERKIKTSTKTHLKVFLLNLYTCYAENPDLCIGVSLSKNTYTGSRIKFNHIIARYTPTKRVVDALKNAGYVHFKIGFNDMRTGTLRKSRICGSSKLEDIFTRLNMDLHTAYTQRPAIILRDSDKNEIPFTETSSTETMKKQVEEINEMVGALSLDFPLTAEQKSQLISRKCYPDISRNRLTRIFNVDFDSGGRFYGHGIHGIPKEYRSLLKINGNLVVELDYSNLHPRMLYAMKGITFKGDCYDLEGGKGSFRPIVKQTINTLINARSEEKALQSLLDGRKMSSATRELFLRAGLLYVKDKKIKQNRKLVREFIAKVKTKHAPISEYFGTGEGVKLQKIDSDIAARIILRLCRKGIGCLPLHDSFIVEAQNEQELLSQMKLAYYENFSLPPMIDKKY